MESKDIERLEKALTELSSKFSSETEKLGSQIAELNQKITEVVMENKFQMKEIADRPAKVCIEAFDEKYVSRKELSEQVFAFLKVNKVDVQRIVHDKTPFYSQQFGIMKNEFDDIKVDRTNKRIRFISGLWTILGTVVSVAGVGWILIHSAMSQFSAIVEAIPK